jgi:uncharacterized protein (DUF342 family)
VLGAVVGMAVAADRKQTEAKAAFMIPISVAILSGAIKKSMVTSEKRLSTTTSFQEVKCRALRKNLNILVTQYEAAYNQKSTTLNDADQPILDEKIGQLEQKIAATTLELEKNNCQ